MPPRVGRRVLSRRWSLVAAMMLALVLLSCNEGSTSVTHLFAPTLTPQGVAYDPGMIHIHQLAIDDTDGSLYIATHTGLFRIPAGGEPERVAGIMDLMGFMILEPGLFLGSGHPSPAMIEGQKLPPHLGLIRSTDGGHTWEPVALLGEADFHVLRPVSDGIYGYNAFERQLLFSTDMIAWETRALLDLYDLVADPEDSRSLIAATPQGLAVSDDGGNRWKMQPDAPAIMALAWAGLPAPVGITRYGEVVVRKSDSGWETVFQFPAAPEALTAHKGTLLAAIRGRGVWQSQDMGRSWEQLMPPQPAALPR